MANDIPKLNLTIDKFMNALHMKDADTLATSVEKTKGVLYLDSLGKIRSANRHSSSLTLSSNNAENNVALRLALVDALTKQHLPKKDIALIRKNLGLTVAADGKYDIEASKPLSRREVKKIISDTLGRTKLDYSHDKLSTLQKMAKTHANKAQEIEEYLDFNKESDLAPNAKNDNLKKDTRTALKKCASYFKANAEALSAFQSSKRGKKDELDFRAALKDNKQAFIDAFFPEGKINLKLYNALARFQWAARNSIRTDNWKTTARYAILKNKHIAKTEKVFNVESFGEDFNTFAFKDEDSVLFDTGSLGKSLREISHELEKYRLGIARSPKA